MTGPWSIPEDNIDPYQVLLLSYFGEQAIGDGSLVAERPCWLVLVPWVLHDRRDGTAMQCFPFLHGRNVPEIMSLSLANMVVAGRNPVQPRMGK
jgi:hypothetical protein